MTGTGEFIIILLLSLAIIVAIIIAFRKINSGYKLLEEVKQRRNCPDEKKTIGLQPKSEEEVAAFMALHLYLSQNRHDNESNVLTIERIQRRYSPWSSKIYSVYNTI